MKHFLASDKEGVSLRCTQGVLIPYLGAGYLSHFCLLVWSACADCPDVWCEGTRTDSSKTGSVVTPAFPSKACGHVAAFKKLSGASFIQGFLLTAAPDLLRPFCFCQWSCCQRRSWVIGWEVMHHYLLEMKRKLWDLHHLLAIRLEQ